MRNEATIAVKHQMASPHSIRDPQGAQTDPDVPVSCIQWSKIGATGVCAGCSSQSRRWRYFGSRTYVTGLLIGSRAAALTGLRTRRGLIRCKVDDDH